ncbi:zinc-ribbon domain-containing protein [Eubacteriales bacterium OttesenSCG-928-N13]|nr:zinc-ribbon domain-containing protein [Eubacteriales bacterium OttesenSCG-928-N13]
MFCIECGKPNPDQAKFCAFCGAKLLDAQAGLRSSMPEWVDEALAEPDAEDAAQSLEEQPSSAAPSDDEQMPSPSRNKPARDQVAPAQKPQPAANRATPAQKPQPARDQAMSVKNQADRVMPTEKQEPIDPHQRFKRPSSGPNVRPLVDNPAQPLQDGVRGTSVPKNETVAAPKTQDAPARNAAPSQRQDAPARNVASSQRQDAAPQSDGDVEKPTRPVTHRPPANRPSTSGAEKVNPPPRKPNIARPERAQDISHKRPSASPFRQVQLLGKSKRNEDDDDLFFEDLDASDDFAYDDDEDRLSKRLISIIVTLVVVLVIGSITWLFVTDGGKMFRAQFGMGGSAETFAMLGATALNEGETSRAAEAYFNALKLNPNSYEYSLMVGKTSEMVGNRDRAVQAYQKCMDIDMTKPEPYRLLAELWERQGSPEAGAQVRRQGAKHTGDTTLTEGIDGNATSQTDDFVPANGGATPPAQSLTDDFVPAA